MEKFRTTLGEFETSTVGRTGDTPFVLDVQDDSRTVQVARSHQVINTEGHQFRLLGRSRENIGGPFSSHKVEIDIGHGDFGNVSAIDSWSSSDGINDFRAYGKVVPSSVAAKLTATPTASQIRDMCPVAISDLDLDKHGTTAISLVAPRNPLADAASTIGELRDGLPSIPNPTKNVGGEYLNVVFGIQPIASEVEAYYHSWRNAEKLLAQLERDSGKWVRRGFHFDPVRTSEHVPNAEYGSVSMVTSPSSVPYAYNVDGSTRFERVTTTETKIWFSGCFTYHLPKSGWRRTLDELDFLYGVKPGVDTAWELMPWSWLVDWYSNAGDVLKNINAFSADGLVMPYGYVMASQKKVVSYYLDLWSKSSGGTSWENRKQQCAVTTTTLQRRPANPFGFGFSWDSISLRQGAILAALGISRA